MTRQIGMLDKKLFGDTAWNYGAFAAMACTGVVLNFFIAAHFGIEALGQFNQIYAFYIVTAQLAVFGVHDSAQKHVAEHITSKSLEALVANTAFGLAGFIGFAVGFFVWLIAGFVGNIVESEPVGRGLAMAAPGLALFSMNKVLMGVLNGQRRMKAFAIIQGLRMLSILMFALFTAYKGWPAYFIGAGFAVAEAIILIPLLVLVKPLWRRSNTWGDGRFWVRRHLEFGAKALPNGFLTEGYIRVDVLMLSIFVDDAAIGIYSFAAMFIEGLYQVPVVIRTVINPVLVRLISGGDKIKLTAFARRIMLLSLVIFVFVAGPVCFGFPLLTPWFPKGLVANAEPILWILIWGLGLYAAFIPLDFILIQAGYPGRQSMLMTFNILSNVGFNVWLIPDFGIVGAAVATSCAFVISGLSLNLVIWRWLAIPGGLFFKAGITKKIR